MKRLRWSPVLMKFALVGHNGFLESSPAVGDLVYVPDSPKSFEECQTKLESFDLVLFPAPEACALSSYKVYKLAVVGSHKPDCMTLQVNAAAERGSGFPEPQDASCTCGLTSDKIIETEAVCQE